MKKIIYTVLTCAIALSFTACDDFFGVKPVDKVAADTFLSNEQEISLFARGLIQTFRPDADAIAAGDNGTDLISKRDPSKFWFPNDIYTSADRGAWSYTNVRRANTLIYGMEKAKGKIPEEVYNHYQGVGRFWRAYFHFDKVQVYGDLPWQDKLVDPSDSLMLYAPRDNREFVVNKCIEDLKFAVENCFGDDSYKAQINKWVAAAYLSQIALYEGTLRKYHDVNRSTMTPWTNEYGDWRSLLEISVWASEVIINSGKFKLNGNYAANFVTEKLYSNPEMIWVAEYSTDEANTVTHSLTSDFRGTNTIAPSPTKNYVNQFLKIDGTPMETDKISLLEELAADNGRDPRLNATVNHVGWTYKANNGTTPYKYMPCSLTPTGYNLIKYNIEEENQFNVAKCGNSIPIFRYAEILLNYAEAKAELNGGVLSDADWDLTIGALRKRAGMTGTSRPAKVDPVLYKYYADAYDYEEGDIQGSRAAELKGYLTPDIVEIRRERVCEMGYEGRRYDDLVRWHCLSIVPMRGTNGEGTLGIWVSKEDAKNGFLFNPTFLQGDGDGKYWMYKYDEGTKEYVRVDKKEEATHYAYHGPVTFDGGKEISEFNFKVTTKGGQQSLSLSEGDHGYMIFHYPLEWNSKKYLYPISQNVLTNNPNITQNFGWE